MWTLLELIRVVLVLVIGNAILWILERSVYVALGVNVESNLYLVLTSIANLLIIFILYRNKLQFLGWYKGNKNRLPKATTIFFLLSAACCLFIIPFLT
ncbi:hypothetical protein P4S93_15395 [Aneurinibacillus thermoaerophilus]|uniref:Uncharacterized protein n=1 Tax=Aneurinibacillus thermoaerophilus TaxID=143495 RepID=A0A1G8F8A2_ANETH|nr:MULTISPECIES: hypothetical protein [Aneurinibacillus]AMA74377.1 hypothetical protein ACH33_17290 [Aneurinibacillus sp. XH2]MED0680628.1 hypothetical protein [Aneurinibacillus thermoaerophilus]MED0757865.1 hypothetical protein [Aneurinibacillus thermoaerophilus]MED0762140.1 hypothetical protein [Aneurinibacillus thermoaerophilus]QYY43041.1 hypothetical protein K3F53_01520 [Aneurinibacillus thermoaerophilus]